VQAERNESLAATSVVSGHIETLLASRGIARADLAEHLGMVRSSLWRRFTDQSAWTIDELVEVAKWLDVDLDTLLDGAAEAEWVTPKRRGKRS